MKKIIIKLGGSLLSPYRKDRDPNDPPFDKEYADKLIDILEETENSFGIMIGGGFVNRWYLEWLKKLLHNPDNVTIDLHYIGIAATVFNAQVFKTLLTDRLLYKYKDGQKVYSNVLMYHDYDNLGHIKDKVKNCKYVIGAGGPPGVSSDYDALLFADCVGADTIISLKNVDGVYDSDPKKNPHAKRIDNITWEDYFKIIGVTEHVPGANLPVDYESAKLAQEKNIRFVICGGDNIELLREYIQKGEISSGTVIAN